MASAFSGKNGVVVGPRMVQLTDNCRTWKRVREPEAGLTGATWSNGRLYVSGARGIYRSADRGESFKRIFDGECVRVSARGDAVVAACSAPGGPLVYSADGDAFSIVGADGLNGFNAGLIDAHGILWAVGTWERVLRGGRAGVSLVSDTPGTRAILEVARDEAAKQPARPPASRPADLAVGTPRSFKGRVHQVTGKPIAGVTVELVEPDHEDGYRERTTTDATGAFSFPAAKPDALRVFAFGIGWRAVVADVTVNPQGERLVELVMKPSP
jgi:hypothetical protein